MQYKDRVEQRKSQIALEQWRTSVKSLEVNNRKGYTETIYNDGSMLVRDHATKTEEFRFNLYNVKRGEIKCCLKRRMIC